VSKYHFEAILGRHIHGSPYFHDGMAEKHQIHGSPYLLDSMTEKAPNQHKKEKKDGQNKLELF